MVCVGVCWCEYIFVDMCACGVCPLFVSISFRFVSFLLVYPSASGHGVRQARLREEFLEQPRTEDEPKVPG